jgi:hypothetical protein
VGKPALWQEASVVLLLAQNQVQMQSSRIFRAAIRIHIYPYLNLLIYLFNIIYFMSNKKSLNIPSYIMLIPSMSPQKLRRLLALVNSTNAILKGTNAGVEYAAKADSSMVHKVEWNPCTKNYDKEAIPGEDFLRGKAR